AGMPCTRCGGQVMRQHRDEPAALASLLTPLALPVRVTKTMPMRQSVTPVNCACIPSDNCERFLPSIILSPRDTFQVIWIDAVPHTAKVIEFRWQKSTRALEAIAMGKYPLSSIVKVAIATVDCAACPEPATGLKFYDIRRQKPLF